MTDADERSLDAMIASYDPLRDEFAKLDAAIRRRDCPHRTMVLLDNIGAVGQDAICRECGQYESAIPSSQFKRSVVLL